MKEGVVIPKNSDVTISITAKTHTLKILCGLALTAGSWEEMPPVPFVTFINPVYNGSGLPFIQTFETVYFNPPADISQNLLEGDNMYHEIPGLVGGNTRLGGALINKEKPKAAFI